MTDPLSTIRQTLEAAATSGRWHPCPFCDGDPHDSQCILADALAACDALEARLAEAEKELSETHNALGGESMRCERAEARLAEAEKIALAARAQLAAVSRDRLSRDLRAADAERDRLKDALELVITCAGPWNGTTKEPGKSPAICPGCLSVARAALCVVDEVAADA